ncbi:MAG: flavoprotein [Candidatus Hydrothermota bacterium]|nr:MAG: flavoprotein [Candidatus Hydrothermae bacterium]
MIAWAITGGEYLLRESVSIIETLGPDKIEIFLSRAAEEVLRANRLADFLKRYRVFRDSCPSSPEIKFLYKGRYDLLVVAPATSNTVAKFVHGISDTLVTNLFAQAGKVKLPIIVLPTDFQEVVKYETPGGKKLRFYPRPIDLENVRRLGEFEGVKVVTSPEELKAEILNFQTFKSSED